MILVFLIWVFLFFILFILGFSIVKVLCNIIGQKANSQSVTLDEYFFIGLLSLSSASGILSIWIPIGNKVFLFVIGLSLILFLYNFREILSKVKSVKGELRLLKQTEALFVLLIILFLLAVVVQKITWYDTGLYHAQSIQWIRKFAVVPGLGNIHGRLALNSMFLVISGLFTFQIKDVLIFPMNGICYIVLILKLFALIKAGFDNDTKWKAAFFSLIFLISLITMIPFLNSTSPDIICGILIVYAFVKLTSWTGELGEFNYVKSMLLALVVFSCITYKISSLFLAITLLLNFRNEFLKRSLIIISIGILTLVPYIVRNYYLSGYLIYPFPSVDIFHPDWKIPFEKALSEKYWIVSWARIPGAAYNEVLNMKMSEWILPWFKSNDFYNKLILIINSLSVFTFLSMLIRRDFEYAKIQVVIFINLIFWFMMAPDPRFAYGFLFVGFSLTIAYIIKIVEHLNPDGILRFLKITIVCFFIIILGRRISLPLNILKQPSLCVIPAPFEKVDTKVLTADFNYTVPVADDRCFYSDIPCVPFQLNNVKLRGPDLQDGFKVIAGNPK